MSPEIQTSSLDENLAYQITSPAQKYAIVTRTSAVKQVTPIGPSTKFSYKVIKRGFDIVAVLLISPFVALVSLTIAFFILLEEPGAVFFSHTRIGRGQQYFSMWKFRTMCDNAQEALEKHFERYPEDRAEWLLNHKLKKDPRISSVGSFLRRTSLDELPQIWNVLKGDMSLVGPRPIVYEEIQKYSSDFKYYASVIPGVTGLWQISGRSNVSYDERVALDRFYVEDWSLWLEFKILWKTVLSVASSNGAY